MTRDDVYFAAVEGDIKQLDAILNQEPQLLNEVFSVELDDGAVFYASNVFSILVKMHENGINPKVLDCMYRHGADFNLCLRRVESSGEVRQPLLQYPVGEWNDYDIAAYLLEHGADPNAVNTDTVNTVLPTKTNMLWYAINRNDSPVMTELLLSYGADPNGCCEVYINSKGVYQLLPPLYYSVVECASPDITATLLRFGALPLGEIDLGSGYAHRNSVYEYIRTTHPDKLPVMEAGIEAARNSSAPQIRNGMPSSGGGTGNYAQTTTSAQTAIQKAMNGERSSERMYRTAPKNSDRLNISQKKCYSKFTAYLFANFFIIGLGFGVIGPLTAIKNDPKLAGSFFLLGIPAVLLDVLIAVSVNRRAKKRGQYHIMGEFFFDSAKVFLCVLMCMTIFLIPFVVSVIRSDSWETKHTTDGREVTVRSKGGGEYEDALGNRYRDRED